MTVIGLISPGQMGASIGAAASHGGARVIWAGDGRGESSHVRASDAGIEESERGCLSRSARSDERDRVAGSNAQRRSIDRDVSVEPGRYVPKLEARGAAQVRSKSCGAQRKRSSSRASPSNGARSSLVAAMIPSSR